MSQLNIFQRVKQHVTTRQAASFYGLKVLRNGMCRCPFHDDHTPSLKVDERYHCFGCGADGDVISFTSQLFNMSPFDAAKKLSRDFGVSSDTLIFPSQAEVESNKRIALENSWFDTQIKRATTVLLDYRWLIRDWEEFYGPKNPTDEIDPLFVEAMQNREKIDFYLDTLMHGDKKEQIGFIVDCKKEVDRIEERIRRYHGS